MIRAPMMVSRLRRGLEKMTKNDDMKGVLRELAEEAMITGGAVWTFGPPVCPQCGKGWLDPFWDDEKNEVYHRCPVCGHGARSHPGASSPVPVLAVATVETRVFRVTTSNKLPSTPVNFHRRDPTSRTGRGLAAPSPGLSPLPRAEGPRSAKRGVSDAKRSGPSWLRHV